jgi:hypothetical protein
LPEIDFDIILQMEQLDGTFKCIGFNGVPAARKSWICLVSAGSRQGRERVAELRRQMEVSLQSTSPEVRWESACCPAEPDEMDPGMFRERRKLLVLVAAGDRRFSDVPWYSKWESDEHDAGVMTILPTPDLFQYLSPSIHSDDHLLRRINALAWSDTIAEVLPAILSRAKVTTDTARVFISYRRSETQAVAVQLYDRLIHEGFEVFLDRFSIPPGYDFQRRLNQELEDKSMILLLELPSLKDSKWTQHEIDFAKRYRLGLACVRMPDATDADILPSVAMRPRLPLSVGQFSATATAGAWPRLTGDAEEEVVSFVKREHAIALFEKRYRLRQDVTLALHNAGVTVVNGAAVGPLRAEVGAQEHLIWLTTRPPDVDDFRSLHGADESRADRTPAWRAAIVGPQAALEPDSRKRLQWLADRSGCMAFDEAKLSDFANCVASWK